MVVQAVV